FFTYLHADRRGGNYRAAGDALDALDALVTSPAARFRLLCLRAQVDLGLGETARARQLIRHLRDTTTWPLGRLEETPAGLALTPLTPPDRAWLDLLESSTLPGLDGGDQTTPGGPFVTPGRRSVFPASAPAS